MREKILAALFGTGGILKVRAILAEGLLLLVAYGFVTDRIEGKEIVTLATAAVFFYFGQRSAQQS